MPLPPNFPPTKIHMIQIPQILQVPNPTHLMRPCVHPFHLISHSLEPTPTPTNEISDHENTVSATFVPTVMSSPPRVHHMVTRSKNFITIVFRSLQLVIVLCS
jgi:hypothetical protein